MKNRILLLFHFLVCSFLYGQSQNQYLKNGVYSTSFPKIGNINNGDIFTLINPNLPYNIEKVNVRFTLDFAEEVGNIDFGVNCKFTPSFPNNGNNVFVLGKNKTVNTKSFSIDPSQISSLTNVQIVIDDIQTTVGNGSLSGYLSDRLRASIHLDIYYKMDVNGVQITNREVDFSEKTAKFRWNQVGYAPNYQIQILKLYNFDNAGATNPNTISTKINWNDALTLETQSDQKFINLTISEGSGFYLWRVRPVGNFYENGIANPKNHGIWSNEGLENLEQTMTVSVPFEQTTSNVQYSSTDKNNNPFKGFFYRDKDENINYIYGRTFTEKSGISEKVSYATTLQQTKQNQTYLPSKNNTVTSQTVYDNSGRPTLNSLPVPQQETELTGYKNKFMTPESNPNRPYKAEDFDQNSTIRNPAKVNNSNFSYYTGINHVASAEGYVFSRVLYDNDGTGKVKEQSGVGKKHSIAPENDIERGKTTITKYEKAAPTELLRLFGNEAPDPNSVVKVITFDPNGTGSITYTSKEGKTIATCLYAKQEKEDLDDLSAIENSLLVKDFLTINTSSNNKIISSRTLNIVNPTSLNLTYSKNCTKISANFPIELCKYDMQVVIGQVEDDKTFPTTFQAPTGWMLSSDRKILSSNLESVGCTAKINLPTIPNFPVGSYIIEKQLTPKSSNGDQIAALQNQIYGSTMPLVNMISDWLGNVKCSKDVEIFYQKIIFLDKGISGFFNFDNVVNGIPLLSNNTLLVDDINIDKNYYRKLHNYYAAQLSLATVSNTNDPFFTKQHTVKLTRHIGIDIITPSCDLLRVAIPLNLSIDLKRIELKPLAGSDYYKVNPLMFLDEVLKDIDPIYQTKTQFYPDIEGYSYGYLWENATMDVQTIMASLNQDGTALLKGTKKYILNDLYPNQPNITTLPSVQDLIAQFKNVYANQMHFPNIELLEKDFVGKLESDPTQNKKIKDFLKLKLDPNFPNMTLEDIAALKIIYIHYVLLRPYMEGWEVPGTFALMTYKMLTDNYSTDGFTHDNPASSERKLIYDGPVPRKDDCDDPISLYNPNSTTIPVIPIIPDENATSLTYNRQYYAIDLIKIWQGQLSMVKTSATLAQININSGNTNGQGLMGFIADISPQNLQPRPLDSFDQQAGAGVMANHINANIKLGFFARLMGAKKRIRRRIAQVINTLRVLQIPPGPGRASYFASLNPPVYLDVDEERELNEMPYINPKYNYHLISEFLNSAGYKFAKILTPYDKQPLSSDVTFGVVYGTVDPENYDAPFNSEKSFDGKNRNYKPNRYWRKKYELDPINGKNWKVQYPEIDPNIFFKGIYDPVYAFKYFEYHGNGLSVDVNGTLKKDNANAYRMLEIQNCFYDYSRNDVQSNTSGNDCYVCMIGKVGCSQTSKNWSSGQRIAFYNAFRDYIKDTEEPYDFDSNVENIASPGYFTDEVTVTTEVDPITEKRIVTSSTIKRVFKLWESAVNSSVPSSYELPNGYNALSNNQFIENSNAVRYKTLVELDLDKYNANAGDACDARRPSLYSDLLKMLENKCYKIVDCIPNGLSATERKKYVLRADLNKIVDEMINECKQRGKMNSFRAYNKNCQYAYWMVNPAPTLELNNGVTPIVEYGVGNGTTTNSYNVLYADGETCYKNLSNEKLKLSNGVNIQNMSNIQNNTCVTFSNINLPIVVNCEWTKREQTLKLEMKMDMPCVCDDLTKCVPNQADSFCNCISGQNCGGTVCVPTNNTPSLQSVNGNNMPKIKTEVTKKTITIQD